MVAYVVWWWVRMCNDQYVDGCGWMDIWMGAYEG